MDTKINIDELVDIRDVKIDPSLPVEEKKKSYLQQIKNPYLYRYDDTIIRISFANNGIKLKDLLVQYLLSKQGMSL